MVDELAMRDPTTLRTLGRSSALEIHAAQLPNASVDKRCVRADGVNTGFTLNAAVVVCAIDLMARNSSTTLPSDIRLWGP